MLHHMSRYGSVGESFWEFWGAAAEFLSSYGNCAVQVFFAVSGYLFAAGSFGKDFGSRRWSSLGTASARRWARLAGALIPALALSCAAQQAAAQWGWERPEFAPLKGAWQFAANALLLPALGGQEAIQSGIWYLAVDLQLFALSLAARIGFGKAGAGRAGAWPAFALACGLWLLIGRDEAWDWFGGYFWIYFAMGELAAQAQGEKGKAGKWLAGCALAAAGLGLAAEFGKIKLAVAFGASALLWAGHGARHPQWLERIAKGAGSYSYALFLAHFSAIAAASAWADWNFDRGDWGPAEHAGLLAACAGLSFAGAAALKKFFEQGKALRAAGSLCCRLWGLAWPRGRGSQAGGGRG